MKKSDVMILGKCYNSDGVAIGNYFHVIEYKIINKIKQQNFEVA